MNNLIKTITPLYNNYKLNKSSISGKEALIIMWEIGQVLKLYIDKNNIAPHNLYRKIYGKSEGNQNITQKSYITREFLGRCFRINAIFSNKEDIQTKLPKLKDFTSFREAMPFFDNPTYKLDENNFNDILLLLNSNKKSSVIIKILDVKKKSINNISNSRTQKLTELELEKQIFIDFYNFVYRLMKTENYLAAINKFGISDAETFNLISKNISSLAQEGVLKYDMPEITISVEPANKFYQVLKELLTPSDEKIRRRFRRLIAPERIIKLSEMIYSFTSEKNFNN